MNPHDVRSIEELLAILQSGTYLKYQLFWGHTPKIPGQIDQSCLSNWYPAEFVVESIRYATTEHFMMAEKAKLFGDDEIYRQVLDSKSPGAAKSLGRKVTNFDESKWLANRFEIVVKGNEAKFSQNESLKEFLRITGSKILVEASPHDTIWGIGMDVNDERATNPSQWNGLNLLGFALMEVRSRLFPSAS